MLFGTVPPPTGEPISTVVFAILGGLFSLFRGGATSALKEALNGLRSYTVHAIDGVTRFAWGIARSVGSVLKSFANIWVKVLSPIVKTVRDVVSRISRMLNQVLKPYFEWIDRIRRYVLEYYERYVRPVLVAIQKTRQVLQILSMLRVPFAKKLDEKLARVESKIIGPMLWILRELNTMQGWLNWAVTAGGLFQRVPFLLSMDSYKSGWITRFYAAHSNPMSSGELLALRGGPSSMSPDQALSDLRALLESNSGPLAEPVARAQAELAGALQGGTWS